MSRGVRLIVGVGAALAIGCTDDDDGSSPDATVARDAAVDSGSVVDAASMDASPSIDASSDAASGGDASVDAASRALLIERGRYLVEDFAICGDCHTPRRMDGSADPTLTLAGIDCFIDVVPADPALGCLPTRNLTNHETGLKNRSDQEIKDMFLKGVRPDGRALDPTMPYYVLGNMSAQDADAIVAFLRTVPGVDHMIGPAQPPHMVPAQPAPRYPEAMIPRPRADYPDRAAAERGRYLAGNTGVCMECHTPRDASMQLDVTKPFQGGHTFPSALLGLPPIFPATIYTANITPHANGIEGWTVEDIVAAIKQGKDKDQPDAPICPPMPSGPMGGFGRITDADARDIAHYLLSLPPGGNLIPEDCRPNLPPPDGGAPDGGATDASVGDAGSTSDAG